MCRVVLASMITALLIPSWAAAGGWWSGIDLDRSTVAVGQRVRAHAEVLFSSASAAAAAREHRFYVYLLRDFDYSVVERAMGKRSPRRWWSINSSADVINVGRVVVHLSDRNLSTARASFIVPELAPGTYALMFCDPGCAHPLGDVIPTRGFTVVADVATARIAQRNDHLEKRVWLQAQQLVAARAAIGAARTDAMNSRSGLDQLQAKMRRIEQRTGSGRDSHFGARWAYAGWLVAGALLAALLVLVPRSRRSHRPELGTATSGPKATSCSRSWPSAGTPSSVPANAGRRPSSAPTWLARSGPPRRSSQKRRSS